MANTAIYDNNVNRAALLRLYEKRLFGKVTVTLDGHAVRVDKLIRDAKLSNKGFLKLREAIDTELRRTFKAVHTHTSTSLLGLARDQVSFAYQNIEASMGDIWKPSRPRISEAFTLENPLYANRTLEQGWQGISNSEKKRLEAVIRKGIANGDTVDRIALEVRRGNIHKITRNQSKALVVTATTSVRTQADHAVYKANKQALIGWQYVSVLDSRTTPICAHRDGTIYPTVDTIHLPPSHFNCRSTTTPVFKSWQDLSKLEGVANIRKSNLSKLTPKQLAFYDGATPMKETYGEWLGRQTPEIQLRHLGSQKKVELFRSKQIAYSKFSDADGKPISVQKLRAMTLPPVANDSFRAATNKLDALNLGANTVDDLINNPEFSATLRDYYLLQAGELNGILSNTNYRGQLLHTKIAKKRSVLKSPPLEMKFNPVTGRYEDPRMYQPNPYVLERSVKLVDSSEHLLEVDKAFIYKVSGDLADRMSVNERAVVVDNLRVIMGRQRKNGEPWINLKAVLNSQMKFDVMNISEVLETQLRKNSDVLKKLLEENFIDPVLGFVQLDDLHENLVKNIFKRNKWEDVVAPKLARKLRANFDTTIIKKAPLVWARLSEDDIRQFYLRFVHRLGMADTPDRDQLAAMLGRDLYNSANINGDRNKWYNLGLALLEDNNKFFEIETFGVQKRRLKSRMSGQYFGKYYDTLSYNIRVVDADLQEYSRLTRKIDVGMRVPNIGKPTLQVREGYKTFFVKTPLGWSDTRVPIISTSSYRDFPVEFIDKNLADSLNWASSSKYAIDDDFHDFTMKLLYFKDDKGKSAFYDELNEYKKYMAGRGDAYERLKSMEWLRGKSFSNNVFIDHRARIYERGFIGPQSGETFRPFLNTAESKVLGKSGFLNLQDQVGSFLGGLDDVFEGKLNSLTFTGRQKIAEKWRPELVKIGNQMLKAKPADIRAILENPTVALVDGEELGKFFRFAIEIAKIDNHLEGNYKLLSKLDVYKTALALEQDASASGAQIIALTTRNKRLAEMSNVVPTYQKQRLYDIIARETFNDPDFLKLKDKLDVTEKDLRKAAKMFSMVSFAIVKFHKLLGTPSGTISSQAYTGRCLKVQRLEYTI